MANGTNLFSTLRIIAGILLLVFLVFFVGIDKILSAFETFNFLYIFPAFASVLIAVTLSAFSLKSLFPDEQKINSVSFLQRYFVSNSLGLISPGRVGDFSIAAMMDGSKSKTVGVVALHKVLSVLVSFIFAFGALGLLGFSTTQIVLLYAGMMVAMIIGLWVLKRIVTIKFIPHYENFRMGILDGLKHPHAWGKAVILLAVRFFFQGLSVFFIFLGFGSAPALWSIVTILAATHILTLIPITYGGLGIREAGFIYLAKQASISTEISLAVLIVDLAMTFVLVIVSGERGVAFVTRLFTQNK